MNENINLCQILGGLSMEVRVHHRGGYSYRGLVTKYEYPDYFEYEYFNGKTDFTEKEWEAFNKEWDERLEKTKTAHKQHQQEAKKYEDFLKVYHIILLIGAVILLLVITKNLI